MSKTTVAINKIKANIDSVSGLDGEVATFMECIEYITRRFADDTLKNMEEDESST